MKLNQNNLNKGNYYIGLDVGTNSVGWAVTDEDYNILKYKGNAMWGVRLFEEAEDASTRRTSRTARRRLARRNQRLMLLQLMFNDAIAEIDSGFFTRLHESALHSEDKQGTKYSLFADKNFTDKDYYKKYPTIYHLRRELVGTNEPHDVRLVFLALHHIMKHRGHFLYEGADSGDIVTTVTALEALKEFIAEEYEVDFSPADKQAFILAMERNDIGVTARKKLLKEAAALECGAEDQLNLNAVCDMLAGATVSFKDLFNDDELKNAEIRSFCLKNNLEDNFDVLSAVLGERVGILTLAKQVFDAARLSQICRGAGSISEAKISLYEKNNGSACSSA